MVIVYTYSYIYTQKKKRVALYGVYPLKKNAISKNDFRPNRDPCQVNLTQAAVINLLVIVCVNMLQLLTRNYPCKMENLKRWIKLKTIS